MTPETPGYYWFHFIPGYWEPVYVCQHRSSLVFAYEGFTYDVTMFDYKRFSQQVPGLLEGCVFYDRKLSNN